MMNNILFLALVLTLFSCKKENNSATPKTPTTDNLFQKDTTVNATYPLALKGEAIFHGKGNCATCHQPEEKIIGPSITDIATIYKKQGGDIVSFLKEDAQPIVDPSQYSLMKTNLVITKSMSQEDLQSLSDYMMSSLSGK